MGSRRWIFSFFLLCLSGFSFAEEEVLPVVVLGGGIGGLSSALYLSRGGVAAYVVEGKEAGGALSEARLVENWPGEISISGSDLVEKIKKQAVAFGAHILPEELIRIDCSKRPFKITVRGLVDQKVRSILASSCIIAMGTTPKQLSVPGEKEYLGRGVSHCALCDGALYRGKKVAVIGGGDAAITEAEYLSTLCEKVTIIVRKKDLQVKDEKRKEAVLKKKNIEVLFDTTVLSIGGGNQRVSRLMIQTGSSNKSSLAVDGVFLSIGSHPNTELFQGQLDLDDGGYIVHKKGKETSVSGIFAVGDIADPQYKQAITAAGDGVKAAIEDMSFLAVSSPPASVGLKVREEKKRAPLVIEITDSQQFQKELKEFSGIVLVDFYAKWCPPCKRLSPLLDQKIRELQGRVKLLKIDVEEQLALTEKYDVREMPTLLIFDLQKQIIARKSGLPDILQGISQLEKEK
jgi:thioredoxin reductase (NADPH)